MLLCQRHYNLRVQYIFLGSGCQFPSTEHLKLIEVMYGLIKYPSRHLTDTTSSRFPPNSEVANTAFAGIFKSGQWITVHIGKIIM